VEQKLQEVKQRFHASGTILESRLEFGTQYHRIDIGQKVHSRVKSVPECQPTSGVAAMLKATKPEEIL
jgi:predicted ribonuclease toxin of YeeF-YezG toxin-antitoxin module